MKNDYVALAFPLVKVSKSDETRMCIVYNKRMSLYRVSISDDEATVYVGVFKRQEEAIEALDALAVAFAAAGFKMNYGAMVAK